MPHPVQSTRSPILSVLRSVAASVVRRRSAAGAGPGQHPPVLVTSTAIEGSRTDPTAAYAPPHGLPVPRMDCIQLGLDLLRATIAGDRDRQRALRDRLDSSRRDPLRAGTLPDHARDPGPDGRPRPIPNTPLGPWTGR